MGIREVGGAPPVLTVVKSPYRTLAPFWVFHRRGQPIRSFRTAWRLGGRRAGLVGMLPHDFRRTAVRNLGAARCWRSRRRLTQF